MFSSMHLMGFGPHDDVSVELTPGGVTHIHGPSECGKSSLLTALCLVLWGVDEHGSRRDLDQLVRDGHDAAELMLSTPRATYGRTVKRRGQAKRWRTQGDVVERFRSEQEWRNALGPVGRVLVADGREVEAGRLVVAPRAWLALAEGAGGGRALRDVLEQATLLPDEDPDAALRAAVAELLGGLDERDTHDQGTAQELRRDASREVDRTEGQLVAAADQLGELRDQAPATPDRAEVQAATATVNLADAWKGYRADAEKAEALARWESADPGEEPPSVDSPDLSALRASRDSLRGRVATKRQQIEQWRHSLASCGGEALAAAEKHLADVQEWGTTCPTCERSRWAGLTERLASAEARVEELRSGDTKAAWYVQQIAEAEAALPELEAALEAAEQAVTEGESAWEAGAARREWEAAVRVRGRRPPEPMGLDEPGGVEPEEDAVARARAVLRARQHAEGAIAQHARSLRRAEAQVQAAEAAHQAAKAAESKAKALVEAIRKAPGVLLRQRLARLGDLGPVSIEVVGEGVRVLVDGRAWHRASTGAQLHADVWLRLALRRVLRMPWLPIVVDDRGRWSGELPELGRAWVLRTTAREGLVSSAATSGREAA